MLVVVQWVVELSGREHPISTSSYRHIPHTEKCVLMTSGVVVYFRLPDGVVRKTIKYQQEIAYQEKE